MILSEIDSRNGPIKLEYFITPCPKGPYKTQTSPKTSDRDTPRNTKGDKITAQKSDCSVRVLCWSSSSNSPTRFLSSRTQQLSSRTQALIRRLGLANQCLSSRTERLSSQTERLSSRTKKPSWRIEPLDQHRTRTEQ